MRRAGQVLSKTEILAGVWEYEFEGDPNIIEEYIRRLRTRIDIPFDRASPSLQSPHSQRRRPGGFVPDCLIQISRRGDRHSSVSSFSQVAIRTVRADKASDARSGRW